MTSPVGTPLTLLVRRPGETVDEDQELEITISLRPFPQVLPELPGPPEVGEVAPPGLGHWSPAWDLIAEPSDTFLDSLSEWEQNDTPETREVLRSAASEFVGVWWRAAEMWEAEGRPGASENVMAHSDA